MRLHKNNNNTATASADETAHGWSSGGRLLVKRGETTPLIPIATHAHFISFCTGRAFQFASHTVLSMGSPDTKGD
ncbi:hypothetical protein Bpfe_006033 [Biomphalaria pfeifferi]|uniref:Uncharacterized protein n=1 Tax=Biomphalaria pfeifferi TaxID=112525 RepID=A0AAD8C2U9_BIOPF|nr:hypothetical protein Bpfe_006033 [Biomphalaria pfeifferi]